MLAMALFLDWYTRSMGSADRDKIEKAWLLRWTDTLGNPSRLPRKVMKAYLDYMDISAETLDDQMDGSAGRWMMRSRILISKLHRNHLRRCD
jgi:hypothetical protein